MRDNYTEIAYISSFLYASPFLAIVSIAIFDYYLYCSRGVRGIATWTGIYSIEGLFLDAVGAIIVLSGGLAFLRQTFLLTDKINRIQNARFELFDEKELNAGDPGFNEIWSIIKERAQIESEEAEKVVRLEVAASGSNRRVGLGSGSDSVYPCVEKEDWSREDLPEERDPKEHPPQRYDRLHSVGNPALVDGWFDQEVRDLEQDAKQVPLRIGVLFFLFGFSYQAVGYLITLFSVQSVPLC